MQRRLALALTATVLAGCAANPMTGRSQLMLVSESQVIAQAGSAYTATLAPLSKQGKIDNDPALKARIETITNRLVYQAIRYRPETANWRWQVAVIDDPKTLNAFCLPGGRMAIYSGLVLKLKATDDEIAQVMGHEIAHALANHGGEKMSNAMAAQGAVAIANVLVGQRGQGAVQAVTPAMAQLGWLLPNSRGAETEADRIGIEIAAHAGYDPKAAAELWKKMMAADGRGGPEWLSTHPASARRMDYLASLVPYMEPIYLEAKRGPIPSYDGLPANVRDVTPGAQLAPPPAAAGRLNLVSIEFERFKRGEALLECTSCALSFRKNQDRLTQLHGASDWEHLAREVLDIGYPQDIAWYYLGAAAEGLGHTQAARRYYEQAVQLAGQADTHCKGRVLDLCAGVELPGAAQARLERLRR